MPRLMGITTLHTPVKLNARQRELLRWLDDDSWKKPIDLGGRDGSHHSKTLAQLAKHGLAERKKSCWCGPNSEIERQVLARGGTPKWPWCRCKGSCSYRRTLAGRREAARK